MAISFRSLALSALLFALGPLTKPASAHEFIVRAEKTQVAAGAALPLKLLSAHVFLTKSEELEPAADVAAAVIVGSARRSR